MKHLKPILSILLAVVLLIGSAPAVAFASSESGSLTLTEVEPTIDPRLPELFEQEDEQTEPEYAPDDVVRVAIVLDDESAIDEGYPVETIGSNKAASDYQDKLCREQEKVVDRIEKKVLDGDDLDVVTNLTLVANLVSADVEYSQIEEIEDVKGVKEVVIENVYEPLEDEQTTGEKADAIEKALTEYTGAGSRIAIIDSGVNDEHQSFDADALNYSLRQSAPDADNNGTVDENELAEYKEALNFMTQSDVLDAVNTKHLHVLPEHQNAEDLYLNDKIPFAYNYSDFSLFTQNGSAGIHGSHVSGIAAANTYIPVQNEGTEKTFVKAEEANAMVGTAPDAQILNLKVFGNVICTDSVIAMAVEDALILGADVLNLSLGTAEVGFSCSDSIFGNVFDELSKQGVLIMGAVGNDGSWVSENSKGRPNKLYADDVNMSLCTPPSSYADFMGVAWADGTGTDGTHPTINESSAYGIPSSLMLQPEITANGTQVNSVDGNSKNGYTKLSGTSMAAPDVTGAAAVVAQYLRTKQFDGDSFLNRALKQNKDLNKGMIAGGLLMSTAEPMLDPEGNYYSLLRQGAGLLNTKRATEAKSFIEIAGQSRGRVKAEVGDCPDGSNTFNYKFTLHNVSDTDRSYVFKTNLFTEDIVTENGIDYLADKTRTLAGTATYKIGDEVLDFSSELNADINRDSKTDADDAQALLDYLSGKNDGKDLNLEVADVNADGNKTTYDAHLILKNLKTSAVTVKANESVTVDVNIKVSEDIKSNYPNGTYLEGFTSVVPVALGETDADVTHTIPILGFCGNWSDPSMFDRNNFVESFSGINDTIPYTQVPQSVYEINYMTYQDEGGNLLKQAVNLYDDKSSIPLDKLALSPNVTIRSVQLTLIRPAGAMCFVIMTKDEAGNRHVEHIDAVYVHQTCAFPSPNSTSGWSRTSVSLPVRATLKKMLKNTGVKEGDTIELGAVAVPEYYEETPGKTINADRIKKLIEEGALGDGAYLTTTVTLDGKAPTVEEVQPAGGTLRVTARDEQSVAFIGLYSSNGTYSFEKHIPDGTEATPELLAEFSASQLQEGSSYNIVVGDYAGNRSMYRFTFGEKQDISGKVIANVRSSSSGGGQLGRGDWVAVDPNRFYYGNGIVFSSDASASLAGADAADGYLWQAFEDGRLCAAPISDVNAKQFICDLSAAGMQTVRDLSFNPKDKMLYATDGSDSLWQIDPMLGDVKRMQRVTVGGKPAALYGLAVNKAGDAVATHYDESAGKSTLVRWQIAGSADTVAAETCSIGHRELSTMRYISLTWRNSARTDLYAACAENLERSNLKNYLYVISSINFENGTSTAYKPNSGFDNNMSLFYEAVRGLVNLAVMPELGLVKDGESAAPAALRILGAKDELIAGDTLQLTAAISPWNAQSAAALVKWQAEGAASVDGNGLVTATGEGKATVTATLETDGESLTAECEIEVKPAPDINVTAVFCEGNGAYYWENFSTARPNDRKRLASSNAYTAGTLNHDKNSLYLFSGSWAYRVDPQTFKAVSLEAAIDVSHRHADAAPGRTDGFYTAYGYFTVENGGQTLLLGSRQGGPQKGFETVTVSIHTGRVDVGALAGIAYKGLVEVEDLSDYRESDKNPDLKGEKYTADTYYVINESGDLFALYCYEAPRWYYDPKLGEPGEWADTEIVYEERLGHVDGVSLPGVSQMTNYATSSMIYDAASEMLVLVSKIGNGAAKVQVIDPATHALVMSREFDDDVRQVGVLYQYDYSDYPDLTPTAANVSDSVQTYAAEGATDSVVEVNEEEQTVTVDLMADGTTNGLTSLAYDPNVLTFSELTASMPYHSFCNDAKSGTVKFAFADTDTIQSATARVTFTYELKDTEQTAALTFNETEKGDPNDNLALDTWTKEITLPAKFVERTLQSIEISHKPTKTSYLEGDASLDTTGLEVTAHYSDGTTEKLEPNAYTVSGYESTPGTHTITVTYKNKTAIFEIEVEAKSLVSISVSKMPDKLEYLEGKDSLDVSGGRLTLRYNNNTSEEIDLKLEMVTGTFDNTKIGVQTVEVSYLGKTTSFDVEVISKTPVSVSVSKNPNKMEYIEGTAFDDAGMELTLQYNNGTTERVTAGWTTSYDFSKAGSADVRISYKGFETSLKVNVIAKSLVSVSVSKNPNKMEYIEGTAFDDAGMELTLQYNNGTSETVTTGWEIGDYDFSKPGQKDVTITYDGKTTALTVTVTEKVLTGIKVTTPPSKQVYLEGSEELDISGGRLTLYYNNGTNYEIELSDEMITDGFDNTKPGKQTVTVTYGGFTTTFEVTVQAKDIERIEITRSPDKTDYVEGTKFDPQGMEITVYYNNGNTETLTEGWELAYNFDKVGTSNVTVSYQGHDAILTVNVVAKTLTRIEVTKMPNHTEYAENADFDGTGMEITLYYDNGTTETITDGWTVEYDFSASGQREVKVSYGGVETGFTVTVKSATHQPVISDGNNDNEGGKNPQTGNDNRWYIWLLLMLSSGGMLALFARRKKRHLSN